MVPASEVAVMNCLNGRENSLKCLPQYLATGWFKVEVIGDLTRAVSGKWWG